MVQVINRSPSISETLGNLLGQGLSGVGEGIQKGTQTNLQLKLEDFRRDQKGKRIDEILKSLSEEEFSPDKKEILRAIAMGDVPSSLGNILLKEKETEKIDLTKGASEFQRYAQNTIGKDQWQGLDARDRRDVENQFINLYSQTGDLYGSMNAALDTLEQIEPSKKKDKEEKGLSAYEKGDLASSMGRIRALSNGISIENYNKLTSLPEDANIFERVMWGLGKFVGDSPFYFVGGTLGAQAGGAIGALGAAPTVVGVPFGVFAGSVIGGGAGTLALPSMINTALEEYHKYLSRGGEGSFGDFIEAVGNTLESGVDAGVEGATFGILSRALPLLKKDKRLAKLFDSTGKKGKVAETITTSAIEAGGILGSRALSGQEVSVNDATDLFTQILGFNTFGRLAPKTQKYVANKISKSGIHPEDFAQNVKAQMEMKGRDPQNPALFLRTVNDVSKEYSKAKNVFQEKQKAPVGKEQLEAKKGEIQKHAERISQEPVEEILKRKESKKTQKARKLYEEAQRETQKAEAKLEVLESAGKKGKVIENSKELTRNEIEAHKNKEKALYEDYLSTFPAKRPEPTQIELMEQAAKHNKGLEEAAKHPRSENAKDLKEKFEKDQKYIEELAQRADREPLPDPKEYDRYTRPLEAYNRAYENLVEEVRQSREKLKNVDTPAARKQRVILNRLADLLEKNIKINRAKVALHKPKQYIRQVARGKGRPFLKQALKDLGIRAKEFEKDFFKVREALDNVDKATQQVGRSALKEVGKTFDEYLKNPSESNAEKLAQQSGVPKEEVERTRHKGEKEGRKIVEAIKEGKSPLTLDKLLDEIVRKEFEYYKKKGFKALGKAMLGGLIVGAIQHLSEKLIGYRPNVTFLAFILPGFREVKFGAGIMKSFGEHFIKAGLNHYWKKKLSTASASEKIRIINSLKKKGWTSADLKKIRSA